MLFGHNQTRLLFLFSLNSLLMRLNNLLQDSVKLQYLMSSLRILIIDFPLHGNRLESLLCKKSKRKILISLLILSRNLKLLLLIASSTEPMRQMEILAFGHISLLLNLHKKLETRLMSLNLLIQHLFALLLSRRHSSQRKLRLILRLTLNPRSLILSTPNERENTKAKNSKKETRFLKARCEFMLLFRVSRSFASCFAYTSAHKQLFIYNFFISFEEDYAIFLEYDSLMEIYAIDCWMNCNGMIFIVDTKVSK